MSQPTHAKLKMKNKVKTGNQPRSMNFVSRAILIVGVLLAIMTLYENDLKNIFCVCSQYALYLLGGHLSYIFYCKKKARIDLEER